MFAFFISSVAFKISLFVLPRRPGHVSSAQNMEMKMKHALTAMRTGIDDEAIPSVGNALQFRNLVSGQHQMPE